MASAADVHWPHGKTYLRIQCAQVRFNPAGKGTSRAEIFRKIVLQVWNVRSILNVTLLLPIPKKFKELPLFSSTFEKNSSFQGLFKRPWNQILNSRAFQGLQGVARTMQDVCSTFDLPGELESFCIRQRQSMLMKFLLLFTKNLAHELNYRLTLIKCCCRHYMKQEKKNTWSKNCETCITQELKGPLLWEFVEDYIYIVKFQKIPIPPPWKGFFSKTPHPSGDSN